MKALRQVGPARIGRYLWSLVLLGLLRLMCLPPMRTAFLRLCGARIGRNTVVQRFTAINVDRGGFKALQVGADCFIGDEVLFDLAAPIVLEDQVTLAARATILTHLNVGYHDHPLQARFPSQTAGVVIRRGSFVGANVTILGGLTIGPEAFIAAGSVVNRDVPNGAVVGGIPARALR